jgi:hypothetical protein
MVFAVGATALFSIMLLRHDLKRIERRRQQHPAE